MFDPITYFKTLCLSNKVTKDKYLFTQISGISELEGIIANRKRHNYFVAVDNAEDGSTIQGQGRGFFERRPTTVFLCGFAGNDQQRKNSMLEELRGIYRDFVSKLIKDKSENPLLLINTERIPFYEIPSSFADGIIGIYFIVTVDNQINLVYDASKWE